MIPVQWLVLATVLATLTKCQIKGMDEASLRAVQSALDTYNQKTIPSSIHTAPLVFTRDENGPKIPFVLWDPMLQYNEAFKEFLKVSHVFPASQIQQLTSDLSFTFGMMDHQRSGSQESSMMSVHQFI